MTAAGTRAPQGQPFEYALLRAVPRVDRGECVNVGVVLYCQNADYLSAVVHLDAARLLALDPDLDVDAVRRALDGILAVCSGEGSGAPGSGGQGAGGQGSGGPAGLSRRERFGWLTAPRSTVVQPGPVHSGVTDDPAAHLVRLLTRLVL